MNRLILVGSPRANGRSAALADQLFEACIEDFPNDEVALAPVSTLDIEGCTGCDACKRGGGFASAENVSGENAAGELCAGASADGSEEFRCALHDDMDEVYPLIDAADELVVVSPVYFAGAPSQLKALLDRLQPYFWTDARMQPKRPAALHVVGEGGDPHGFAPLVGTARSALSVAGFSLDTVYDWVGKIDESGEIMAEAEVEELGDMCAPQGDSLGEALSDQGIPDKSFADKAPFSAGEKRAKLQLFDKQTASFSQGVRDEAPSKGARGIKGEGSQGKASAGRGGQGKGARNDARKGAQAKTSKGKGQASAKPKAKAPRAKGSQGKSGGKGRSRRA